jgi:drug/metabolite transporter (DMT)-like permease
MKDLWIVFLSGFCSGLAGLTYKFRHKHGYAIDVLLLFFSFFFTVFTFLCIVVFGQPFFTLGALIFGLCFGIVNIAAIRIMFLVTRETKISISWTVLQYSVLLPFLLSVIIFNEHPRIGALLGVGCIFISIPLFGLGKGAGKEERSIPTIRIGLLLFLASFLTGVMFSIPKFYSHIDQTGGTFTLLFYSGMPMVVTALVLTLINVGKDIGTKMNMGVFVLSLYMTAANVAAVALLVISLRYLDGSIVYPLRTVVNVLSIFIMSFIFFREKATFLEAVGAVIALAGLVLVSATMG